MRAVILDAEGSVIFDVLSIERVTENLDPQVQVFNQAAWAFARQPESLPEGEYDTDCLSHWDPSFDIPF